MDFFAIVSTGAYPTPTPTNSVRAALAASWGLLDFGLPEPEPSVGVIGSIILGKIRGLFLSEDVHI